MSIDYWKKIDWNEVLAESVLWHVCPYPFQTTSESTTTWIDSALNEYPNWILPFAENIRRIEKSFADNEVSLQHVWFTIWTNRNEPGQNLWSLKVIAYAAYIANLKVKDTLKLFWEHYNSVLETPELDNHKNIRALLELDGDAYVKTLVDSWEISFDDFPLFTTRD